MSTFDCLYSFNLCLMVLGCPLLMGSSDRRLRRCAATASHHWHILSPLALPKIPFRKMKDFFLNADSESEAHILAKKEVDEQIRTYIAPLTRQLEDLTPLIQGFRVSINQTLPQGRVPVLILAQLVYRPTWRQEAREPRPTRRQESPEPQREDNKTQLADAKTDKEHYFNKFSDFRLSKYFNVFS